MPDPPQKVGPCVQSGALLPPRKAQPRTTRDTVSCELTYFTHGLYMLWRLSAVKPFFALGIRTMRSSSTQHLHPTANQKAFLYLALNPTCGFISVYTISVKHRQRAVPSWGKLMTSPLATPCYVEGSCVVMLHSGGKEVFVRFGRFLPGMYLCTVKGWQKRATLGAVSGPPSTAPNPPL